MLRNLNSVSLRGRSEFHRTELPGDDDLLQDAVQVDKVAQRQQHEARQPDDQREDKTQSETDPVVAEVAVAEQILSEDMPSSR